MYTGQKDIPLNEEGIRQAQDIAQQLKDLKVDVCYCSPLIRARQTCKEILKLHSEKIPVIFDDRLKKRDYGKLVDKPVGSIPFNRWKIGADDEKTKEYQIETIPHMYSRLKIFFDEIYIDKNKNILVVAHSGVGRNASAYFWGMSKDNDFLNIKIANGI